MTINLYWVYISSHKYSAVPSCGLQAVGHDLHTDTVSHYGLLHTTEAGVLVGPMGCGATVLSEIIYYWIIDFILNEKELKYNFKGI